MARTNQGIFNKMKRSYETINKEYGELINLYFEDEEDFRKHPLLDIEGFINSFFKSLV